MSLGGLVKFIDGSRHPEEEAEGGLLVCHWEYLFSCGDSPDEAVDFASIQSAWYPELAAYYEQEAIDWCEQKQQEIDRRGEEEVCA